MNTRSIERRTVSEQAQVAEVEAAPEAPVSALLIEAREAAGLSQSDVADQLYLTATFIRYIDDGDFHKIPKGTAFIKGYLRSYARVVGLDGDAIVGRYESGLPSSVDAAPIRDVTEETVGPVTFTGPVLQTGLMALGGLAVVIALVWYFAGGDDAESIGGQSAPEAPSAAIVEPTPEPVLSEFTPAPVLARYEEASPDDVTLASEVDDSAGQVVPGEYAVDAEPAPVDSESFTPELVEEPPTPALDAGMDEFEDPGVNIEREARGEERLITVTADGSDLLEFAFTADCWVQIEDTQNKVIYADLNRGGDVMNVTGMGPFTVLLGKAPAVQMSHNGSPFDLGRFTMSDETAKVRTP